MKLGEMVWVPEGRDRSGLSLALLMVDHLANSGKYSANSEANEALSDLSDMISEACEEGGLELLPIARNLKIRASGAAVSSATGPLPKSSTELELDRLYAMAKAAKEAPSNNVAVCPNCAGRFHKYSSGTVYCSNSGGGNCKDGFFNRVKSLKVKLAEEKGFSGTEWRLPEVYTVPS